MENTAKMFKFSNDMFTKLIPQENFKKEIIVIDKSDFHQQSIIKLIKNEFYPYLYENININPMDCDNINFDIKDKIICVPIAFESGPIAKWIKLGNNNTVIAAMDNDYLIPWSISNIFTANHYLHWACNIEEQDYSITGISAYCALLSIIALNGNEFLQEFIEKVNLWVTD